MPPDLIDRFAELTSTSWRILRTPSTRKEIKYTVTHTKSQNIPNLIHNMLDSHLPTYAPADRSMIFCRTKSIAEEYASFFQVAAYTSQTGQDQQEQIMQDWIEGRTKVMVCTSILGCGFDYPHVRDVFHVNPSYTLFDQYQEDSRAGRDGQPCRATTFVAHDFKPSASAQTECGAQELLQWAANKHSCLRRIPSQYLDGVTTECILLPGAQLCSTCEKNMAIDTTPRAPQLSSTVGNTQPSSNRYDISPHTPLVLYITIHNIINDYRYRENQNTQYTPQQPSSM